MYDVIVSYQSVLLYMGEQQLGRETVKWFSSLLLIGVCCCTYVDITIADTPGDNARDSSIKLLDMLL